MKTIPLGALYRRHFRHMRRERQFIAAVSFFVTFAIARFVTHSMRGGSTLFRSVLIGETHVHHLVWGIVLLIAVGYAWLLQLGTGANPEARRASRFMSMLYGVGVALTLDEFAMWLHLEDVYWERQGRASIDAVVLFGSLVLVGIWGMPFARAVWRRLTRGRRAPPAQPALRSHAPVANPLPPSGPATH